VSTVVMVMTTVNDEDVNNFVLSSLQFVLVYIKSWKINGVKCLLSSWFAKTDIFVK
jgi:hypothetical protein